MQSVIKFFTLLLLITLLFACTGIPKGLVVVDDFDADQFLGTWYEIVRLDHKEERGLSKVSATYSLRDDGGIKVQNKGYNQSKNEWTSIEGKAYFNGPRTQGRLKVSFFGPFYGGYNVIKLEPDYSMAMIAGPKRNYFWILARETTIDKDKLDEYLQQAKDWGFDVTAMLKVEH